MSKKNGDRWKLKKMNNRASKKNSTAIYKFNSLKYLISNNLLQSSHYQDLHKRLMPFNSAQLQ